jgi:hypothetical protein
MSKKYLSLEDAADVLGVTKDELVRLRERGIVRGFADRGTWKFKTEDVEEAKRRRQTDSDPDVPLMRDDDRSVLGADDVLSGDDPTVVRASGSSSSLSDSDVRLILDDSLAGPSDSDPEVDVSGPGDSDSDVSLVDEPVPAVDSGSDSDVKLVGSESDSDVSFSGPAADAGSDSDVKLVGSESDSDVSLSDTAGGAVDSGSDSDVKLVAPDSDSEIMLGVESEKEDWEVRSDSDVRLVADEPGGPASDSDVNLISADALSGVAEGRESVLSELASDDDSGISLEMGESGIALEDAADSGISLASAADSGIALEGLADSGISLADEEDSGIALEAAARKDELDGTVPMLDIADDDMADTAMEVPSLDDDSAYQIAGGDSDTGVLMFDDESGEVPARSKGRARQKESETIDVEDDSGEFADVEAFDEDLEVPEDIIGEEEEIEDVDVFGAADDDFAPSFESGESHAEFVAPSVAGRVAAPVETNWGAGAFAGLTLSTMLMAVCALLMFDLIRTMWAWDEPYSFNSFLLDTFGGMF